MNAAILHVSRCLPLFALEKIETKQVQQSLSSKIFSIPYVFFLFFGVNFYFASWPLVVSFPICRTKVPADRKLKSSEKLSSKKLVSSYEVSTVLHDVPWMSNRLLPRHQLWIEFVLHSKRILPSMRHCNCHSFLILPHHHNCYPM